MEIASVAAYLWADVFLLNYNGPPKSNSLGDNAANESRRGRAAAKQLSIGVSWEEEEAEVDKLETRELFLAALESFV